MWTHAYRRTTSRTYMRTQPCDAAEPIEPGLSVPWKPTPPANPIHRAFSGLPGAPPGITWPAWSPAHELLGTDHDGFTVFDCTWNRPSGVGHCGWPTATRYERTRRRWLNRRARRSPFDTVTIAFVIARRRRAVMRGLTGRVYARTTRNAVPQRSAAAIRSSRIAGLASARPLRDRDARRRRTP